MEKNKSVGPDRIPGEIIKMGGEAMIPYLVRLVEITMNNGTLPEDWKRATAVPIHKGGDRSLVTNYRPISLTSVACKQMEHALASYLRQVWNKTTGYTEGSTDLGRVIHVRVRSSRYVKIQQTRWAVEAGWTLLLLTFLKLLT